MRKKLVLLLCVVALLISVGCTKKEKQIMEKEKVVKQEEMVKENTIVGVVKDSTMSTVIITSNDKDFTFDKSDVAVDYIESFNVGDTVKIYYDGELPADGTAIRLVKLEKVK